MSIEDRIPELSDQHLVTLLANARRLSLSSVGRRQEEAERLVPVVQEEIARRKARAPTAAAGAAKPVRKTTARPVAKAAARPKASAKAAKPAS